MGCGKERWKQMFTENDKWKWVTGLKWQAEMQSALSNNYDVVVNRSNSTDTQRAELCKQIEIYNSNIDTTHPIDISLNVIALVCHPNWGVGSKNWSDLVGIQDEFQIPTQYSYRILDMDDGIKIRWNTEAIQAAVDNNRDKLTRVAEKIQFGPIERRTTNRKSNHAYTMSVMSYNIFWQPTNKCTWNARMPILVKAIQQQAPQIICMQEVSVEMYNDLQRQLPSYGSTFGHEKSSSFGCATFFLIEVFKCCSTPHDICDTNQIHRKPR
jgi:hypothetical protein